MRYLEDKKQYVHRSVAEVALGRPLASSEVIHHVDYDRRNNDPSNLVICDSQAYHMLLHKRQKCYEAGYDPNEYHWCGYHKQYEPLSEFSTYRDKKGNANYRCKDGTNQYRKEKGIKSEWSDIRKQQQRERRSCA